MKPTPHDHVCLRDPCIYCLATNGEALPASVIADDPTLRSLLQLWDESTLEQRHHFLQLLAHATTGRHLRLTPPIRRALVETYIYDREAVMRDADHQPSPYRILPLDEQLGRRVDEFLPPSLAELVTERIGYAWSHDQVPAVAATTLCQKDGPAEDFELELTRSDDRVVLKKFHVVRDNRDLLATIVPVEKFVQP